MSTAERQVDAVVKNMEISDLEYLKSRMKAKVLAEEPTDEDEAESDDEEGEPGSDSEDG